MSSPEAYIDLFDGHACRYGQASDLRVLPGKHLVSVAFSTAYQEGTKITSVTSRRNKVLLFEAIAGLTYSVVATLRKAGSDYTWDAGILDMKEKRWVGVER